jgi:hypothetical protein
MRARQARFLMGMAGLLASLVSGCGDGVEPTPIVPCGDDQEVIVSVNSDPIPVFEWSPACGMASMQVFPSNGSETSWALFTGSNSAQNPLRSRIRYGRAPSGTLAPAPATKLEPGIEYLVTVYRWVGDSQFGAHVPFGSATFQR